jgi:hypothetical protein
MRLQTAPPAPDALAVAGYSLALRITGDEGRAAASVQAASERSPHSAGSFVRAVREEARAHRPAAPPDPATAVRPAALR